MPLSRKHFRRSRDAPIVVRHAAGPQAGKTIHAALCQRTKPPAELLSKLLSHLPGGRWLSSTSIRWPSHTNDAISPALAAERWPRLGDCLGAKNRLIWRAEASST